MEHARIKNYTKHISAVVSQEDYDILKDTAQAYNISLGDVLRGLIHSKAIELKGAVEEQKQPRLF